MSTHETIKEAATRLGLSHQRVRERADLRIRPVGELTLRIVVVDQHHEPGSGTGTRILQHLLIADGIAERRTGPLADHEMDACGLSCLVLVQQERGHLGELGPSPLQFPPRSRAECRRRVRRRRARNPARRR